MWWATTVKLALSTRHGYERMLRVHLTPRLSGRRINSIDWVEVELFATSMLDHDSSPKTISVLSLVMQPAMRARVLREDPAAGHSIPARHKRVRVLTMAEIDQLAYHAVKRDRAAIWLLALTGLRTSELCGLRVMDVDWEQGRGDRQRGADVGRSPACRAGAEDRERRAHHPDPGVAPRRPRTSRQRPRRASRRAGARDRSAVHVANGQDDPRSHPSFATILKVAKALGLKLHFEKAA
jgi:integrase